MYLSNTSKKVKDLFNLFEEHNNIVRSEVSIYIFEEWNNNLINERNEVNPQATDEDYEIFNPTSIILSDHFGHSLASIILRLMNRELDKKQLVGEDDFLKINLTDFSKKIISKFEKLDFIEKIDVIAELLIRYDNEELLEGYNHLPKISTDSGYDIALAIKEYKKTLGVETKDEFPYETI